MERREEADLWNRLTGCETEQYDCVDVYVRIRTSDGAAASIRAIPYETQLPESNCEHSEEETESSLLTKHLGMIIHTFLVSWSDSRILN